MQKGYVKRIYLVTDDNIYDQKSFLKSKNYYYASSIKGYTYLLKVIQWQYLRKMMCILYQWCIFLFGDSICSWKQSCLRLK